MSVVNKQWFVVCVENVKPEVELEGVPTLTQAHEPEIRYYLLPGVRHCSQC